MATITEYNATLQARSQWIKRSIPAVVTRHVGMHNYILDVIVRT